MSAPRRLALRLLAFVALGTCVACGELGEAPAVRFGQRSLTVDELRTAYADLDPVARPSLATRDDRRGFVERLVERKLLLDEGERLLAADTTVARDIVPERQLILVRRLRAIEGGEGAIDSAAVAAAYERMRTTHHVDILCFAREDDARAAKQKGLAGLDGITTYRFDAWVVWSPFPDPIVDAVVDLPIGDLAGPLRAGGGWRLVRVRERKPFDPGPIDPMRPHIFQGLRGRRETAAVDTLAARLRAAADVQVDGAAIELLVQHTREAIVRPGSTEQDEAWAMPVLAGQESTRVATWRDGSLTMSDYVRLLRRQPRSQRPRAMLDAEIRRTVDAEITTRLLLAEAERRGLPGEYWVLRAMERSRQERALQRAILEIERTGRVESADSAADSLAAHLHATQPNLFAQAARARVLRFDFPTAEAGQAEVERIRRAGGPEARLRAILDGDAPPTGLYHLLYVTPSEMPSPQVVPRIFEAGPGAVTGPHPQGDTWVVLACLEVQASSQPSREQVLTELRARLAETTDARRVDEWLKRRKSELGVDVDDAALDALAPGG